MIVIRETRLRLSSEESKIIKARMKSVKASASDLVRHAALSVKSAPTLYSKISGVSTFSEGELYELESVLKFFEANYNKKKEGE